MYLITDEEAAAVKAMRQAYDRLKELGWEDILRFKPEMIPFGSAPFLGIEVGSYRPIECEYRGKSDEGIASSPVWTVTTTTHFHVNGQLG